MKQHPDQSKLIAEIKKASNILVALNASPSIDELSSALGLTLMLNKNKRRALAIFSGQIPDVLGFLNLAENFDVNADGLRDFIITLDAKKADRVVCRAEDGMVKVYITPSGSIVKADDLEFSQGDYNVDLVIGLGVSKKDELDKALAAHGRILHSASVASIMIGEKTSNLGTINLRAPQASSYAEVLFDLKTGLDAGLTDGEEPAMDQAVATAFLTGLVAVTDRFSNQKTSAEVMALAAELMKLGANQQLVVNELAKGSGENETLETKNKSDDKNKDEVKLNLDQIDQADNTILDLKNTKLKKTVASSQPTDKDDVQPETSAEQKTKVTPSIDNLEAYNAQQLEVERNEVAQEIMQRLEQEQAAKSDEVNDNVKSGPELVPVETNQATTSEITATGAIGDSTSLENNSESDVAVTSTAPLPLPNTDSAAASTATVDDQLAKQLEHVSVDSNLPPVAEITPLGQSVKPGSNIVFGRETNTKTPTVQTAWGQAQTNVNQASVVANNSSTDPINLAGSKEVKPLSEPSPTSQPEPDSSLKQAAEPVAALPPLPPLPDFSDMPIMPPTPPLPPNFEASSPLTMPPVPPAPDQAVELAQPVPEVNPFDQYGANLQTQPELPSPIMQNPIMQDQVYPPAPADKSQFVIPE